MTSHEPPPDRVEVFRSIFDAHYRAVEMYCRRRASESMAGDAISEVFLTAWRRLDDIPPGPEAKLWLFGVARNTLANLHRSEARRNDLHLRLINEPTVSGAPLDPSIEVVGTASPVLDALDSLSPDDRDVLTMVTWDGLSHAEVARILGCSTNAVGIRIHRARQRLADALTKDRS